MSNIRTFAPVSHTLPASALRISPEYSRMARLNRAYLQTAIALHAAGQDDWLLSRFDLSAEMLDDLSTLSPEALESLHADMNTTLFSVEVDADSLAAVHEADAMSGLQWADASSSATAAGTWLMMTVLQEVAVSNVHSDSSAYAFNCEQSLADHLSAVHPLLLASLVTQGGVRLKARFSRNHVMAADVASAFPVGLLMALS